MGEERERESKQFFITGHMTCVSLFALFVLAYVSRPRASQMPPAQTEAMQTHHLAG